MGAVELVAKVIGIVIFIALIGLCVYYFFWMIPQSNKYKLSVISGDTDFEYKMPSILQYSEGPSSPASEHTLKLSMGKWAVGLLSSGRDLYIANSSESDLKIKTVEDLKIGSGTDTDHVVPAGTTGHYVFTEKNVVWFLGFELLDDAFDKTAGITAPPKRNTVNHSNPLRRRL